MSQRRSPADDELDPTLVAALAEAAAPVTPPPGLRARVLDRVRMQAGGIDFSRLSEGAWRVVMPGIEVKPLLFDGMTNMVSFLLRAQPGAQMPGHGHRAFEECLVLEGEFTMGEVTMRAGDFAVGHPGVDHPVATTRTGVLVYLRGSADDYPFARP